VSLRKQKKAKLLDLRRIKLRPDMGISELVQIFADAQNQENEGKVGNFDGLNVIIEGI
jgi:hypothetical protein